MTEAMLRSRKRIILRIHCLYVYIYAWERPIEPEKYSGGYGGAAVVGWWFLYVRGKHGRGANYLVAMTMGF